MTEATKRLLTHGLLFVMGMGYFMAWDTQLAALMRFPGQEVWRPLTVGWAVLLLYDAARRLYKSGHREVSGETSETKGEVAKPGVGVYWSSESRRAFATTALRFLLFFSVLGTIAERSFAGVAVVSALFLGILFVNRLWKVPPQTSESGADRGEEKTHSA
jgi:hypothetical protein